MFEKVAKIALICALIALNVSIINLRVAGTISAGGAVFSCLLCIVMQCWLFYSIGGQ